MFNPESLDLSALPSVLLKNRLMLPKISCIYFAMSDGTIQYIGRSTNLYQRWAAHHRYNDLHPDSHIAWFEFSDSSLLPEIERALIAWFKPPLNGKISRGNPPKSSIETIYVASGKLKTLSVQLEDLETLKQLQRLNEHSLAVTFHRIIEQAKMYDAISKAGNFVRITGEAQTNA